jgi:hypothetical protein
MSDPDTEALLKERFPWLSERQLSIAVLDDYPNLRYVTILDEHDEPLIGGPAYVVNPSANQVVKVSASRPPRTNLDEAQKQMHEFGGGEAVFATRVEMFVKLVRNRLRARRSGRDTTLP